MTETTPSQRLGTMAILIANREQVSAINSIISQHERLIIGRMGLPYREKRVNIIVLLVEGSGGELGAFSDKLGAVTGVKVQSVEF